MQSSFSSGALLLDISETLLNHKEIEVWESSKWSENGKKKIENTCWALSSCY